VSLHEISGNVATFEFSELKPNIGLGNEVFDFKTPPDVEVVKAPVLNGP
jgi:outer membrane lipoprotein carrier protein